MMPDGCGLDGMGWDGILWDGFSFVGLTVDVDIVGVVDVGSRALVTCQLDACLM